MSLLSASVLSRASFCLARRTDATSQNNRLKPSPLSLTMHFFCVAFYSIWLLFTAPRSDKRRPSVLEYPALTIKSAQVFWTACVVLLPYMWNEFQM